MNTEQLVVCPISLFAVLPYLTSENLNCGEIYWKIVETFGENVITKQKNAKMEIWIDFATFYVLSG